MGRTSFQKRQKEMKRQEKKQMKAEKRAQRKLERNMTSSSETEPASEILQPVEEETGVDTRAV